MGRLPGAEELADTLTGVPRRTYEIRVADLVESGMLPESMRPSGDEFQAKPPPPEKPSLDVPVPPAKRAHSYDNHKTSKNRSVTPEPKKKTKYLAKPNPPAQRARSHDNHKSSKNRSVTPEPKKKTKTLAKPNPPAQRARSHDNHKSSKNR